MEEQEKTKEVEEEKKKGGGSFRGGSRLTVDKNIEKLFDSKRAGMKSKK